MKKDTVVIDLDGCLNYYPDPLKMWAEVFLNLNQSESKQAIKKENDFDLLKKTYRQSKILCYLLPKEGAKEVLQKIKKRGYLVTILTSRNLDKNPKIRTITVNWLKKYEIPFDSIIFTKDKSVYLKQNEDRIVMVVEDDPEFLNSFEKLRTKVFAPRNDLNQDIKDFHFQNVASWEEIGGLFEGLIKKSD